jgi:outer membrane receptor protein involved in Fe transport
LNTTSQPAGVGPRVPPQSWGDSDNTFHTINARYARIFGGSAINELTFQYATFANTITANTTDNTQVFPNGVVVGVGLNIPQATEQRKIHLRDDISMHVTGRGGLGHDIKTGIGVAHDPFLGFPASIEPPGFFFYSHTMNDPGGPISQVSGNTRTEPLSFSELSMPLTQLGVYVQDDWRVTDRLTVNAGLRYDVTIGYQIDQSKNPNFVVLQDAARAGRFANVIGMEDFGKTPRNDYDNVQPRVGFTLDVRGQGKDVIRGGWGIYTDMAYTNANILFAAFDAQGILSTGQFVATSPNGLRNPDGSFFTVGQPVSNIASLNEGGQAGLNGEVVSPRLRSAVCAAGFLWLVASGLACGRHSAPM